MAKVKKKKARGGDDGEEVSIRTDDRTEGGGLANDINCKIKRARYSMRNKSDYKNEGSIGDPDSACCLMVDYISKVDGFEKFSEFYSCGSGVVPNSDGQKLLRAPGSKGGFNNGCKAARYMDSLSNCGVKEAKMQAGIGAALDGLVVHVERVPDVKRETLDGDGGKKRTILLVTEILEGELKSEGKGKASKKKGKKKDEDEDEEEDKDEDSEDEDGDDDEEDEDEEEESDDDDESEDDEDSEDEDEEEEEDDEDGDEDSDDLEAIAVKAVSAVLSDKKHKAGLSVDDLFKPLFRSLGGNKSRTKVMTKYLNEDALPKFVKAHAKDGGWKLKDGLVKKAKG